MDGLDTSHAGLADRLAKIHERFETGAHNDALQELAALEQTVRGGGLTLRSVQFKKTAAPTVSPFQPWIFDCLTTLFRQLKVLFMPQVIFFLLIGFGHSRSELIRGLADSRLAIVVASAVLFAFSIALAVIIERMDHTIRRPVDYVKRFGYIPLGAIPEFSFSSLERVAIKSAEDDPKTTVFGVEVGSQIMQEYMILATRVLCIAPAEHKVFALTSCHHQEGKTTTTCHLALQLSRLGRSVCLVEADLYRPRVHILLANPKEAPDTLKEGPLSPTPGLAEHANSMVDMSSLVRQAETLGFDWISAGQYAHSEGPPAAIFSSDAVKTLFRELRERYDIVLVDCPPSLATADLLAARDSIDSVLLVIRTGVAQQEEIEGLIHAHQESGLNFLGGVMTWVKYFLPKYLYRYQYYAYRARDGRYGPMKR